MKLSTAQIMLLRLFAREGELEIDSPKLYLKGSAVRALLRRELIQLAHRWSEEAGNYRVYLITEKGRQALEEAAK